jgi:hypothetical protein
MGQLNATRLTSTHRDWEMTGFHSGANSAPDDPTEVTLEDTNTSTGVGMLLDNGATKSRISTPWARNPIENAGARLLARSLWETTLPNHALCLLIAGLATMFIALVSARANTLRCYSLICAPTFTAMIYERMCRNRNGNDFSERAFGLGREST